jgi:AsmA-like C-terminal region
MKMTNRKNLLKNKWLWAALVLTAVIVLGACLLVPQWLYGNPLFQGWVESRITEQTNGSFKFKTIKGGIFSADLTGLSLDLDKTPYNVQKVEAPGMNASFALLPLLQNKLVIKSLVMDGGQLTINLSGSEAKQTALPVAASFKMKKGNLTLNQLSRWTLQLSGCDLKAEQSGFDASQIIKGTFVAPKGKVGAIDLLEVEGKFRIESGIVHVEKFTAQLPGKTRLELSGSYLLSGDRSLSAKMQIKTPDIRTLLEALDFSDRFAGEADLTLQAKGTFMPDNRSLDGAGKALLQKIKPQVTLPTLPAFNDAAILQRVRNLDDLKGQALFQLDKDKIVINDLNIKNSDVQVSGSALVGYDRSLASSLTFTGNKKVDSEIPFIARDAFKHDAEGNVIIPFELKATTRDPQVDVGDVVGKVFSNPIKTLNPMNLFK